MWICTADEMLIWSSSTGGIDRWKRNFKFNVLPILKIWESLANSKSHRPRQLSNYFKTLIFLFSVRGGFLLIPGSPVLRGSDSSLQGSHGASACFVWFDHIHDGNCHLSHRNHPASLSHHQVICLNSFLTKNKILFTSFEHLFFSFYSTQHPNNMFSHHAPLLTLSYSDKYSTFPEEAIIINSLAMVLVATGVFIVYSLRRRDFKYDGRMLVSSDEI